MRAVVRCVLVVVGVAASVAAGPADIRLTAANQPYGLAIASVLPARGAVVGVAHPVVVTFRAPVADRRAAERAIAVRSAPAMTGRFEWLDDDTVRWAPDRFWPAHSTVALSVGGESTEFKTRSRRRECGQHLGSHLHRQHRRSRGGAATFATGAAPPTSLRRTGSDAGLDG
jgi:lipoprotein-anchoring transpeptidase ErfK/SrfK